MIDGRSTSGARVGDGARALDVVVQIETLDVRPRVPAGVPAREPDVPAHERPSGHDDRCEAGLAVPAQGDSRSHEDRQLVARCRAVLGVETN